MYTLTSKTAMYKWWLCTCMASYMY